MTVARVLHDAGYATGGFGKWGLGNPGTTSVPEHEGFDVFFGYYDQVHAHNYYTDHLIRNSVSVPIPQDGKHTWDDYSHTRIANETLKFIEQNKDRPFFCYAAWTPPHGDYVIPSDAPYSQKPWSRTVRNYAAMVTLIDKDVGRVMQELKDLGLDEGKESQDDGQCQEPDPRSTAGRRSIDFGARLGVPITPPLWSAPNGSINGCPEAIGDGPEIAGRIRHRGPAIKNTICDTTFSTTIMGTWWGDQMPGVAQLPIRSAEEDCHQ